MISAIVITLLIVGTKSLTCTLFDYSQPKIGCVSACPSQTTQVSSNCLLPNQFVDPQGQVHSCPGAVSDDRSLCCPKGKPLIYLDNFISDGACYKCQGQLYNNSKSCCPYSSYLDLSTSVPICTPISTGKCASTITIQSAFKICCPPSQIYLINTKFDQSTSPSSPQCISNQNGYNCDNSSMVCCPAGMYLDYAQGSYACVQTCGWKLATGVFCQNRFCSFQNTNIVVGRLAFRTDYNSNSGKYSPSFTNYSATPSYLFESYPPAYYTANKKNNLLISYTNKCCYALDNVTGNCTQTQMDCFVRVVNRGWSVCCGSGQVFVVANNSCQLDCVGIIINNMCISDGMALNLSTGSGAPTEIPLASQCNSMAIPNTFPVCCPASQYLGETGCQFCAGNIFLAGSYAICCGKNEYFNQNTGRCIVCTGVMDKGGKLCCPIGQFLHYDAMGDANCVSMCSKDNIYNVDYCCDSMTMGQSCSISYLVPTLCSPSYYIPSSCSSCPTFCTSPAGCSPFPSPSCTPTCKSNEVYSQDAGGCLACDPSCISCSLSFSNAVCSMCSPGYVISSSVCQACSMNCLTCGPTTTTCLSCSPIQSDQVILLNGKCVQYCPIQSTYLDENQLICLPCDQSCVECIGVPSQCTIRRNNMYVMAQNGGMVYVYLGTRTMFTPGVCATCNSICSTCYGSGTGCIVCGAGYLLTSDRTTCASTCQSGQIAFGISTAHPQCFPCHPACTTCQNHPQNCVACSNSSTFLSSTLGVNLCIPCISPCLTCSSATTCLSCINGTFLSTTACLPCDSSCKTCISAGPTACTSCWSGNISNSTSTSTSTSSNQAGMCNGCNNLCAVCGANQQCITCTNGTFLYGGSCLNACPSKTYQSGSQCIKCDPTCLSCNANTCLSCPASLPYIINTACLSSCPSGYSPAANQTCIPNPNTSPTSASIVDQTFIIHDGIGYIDLYLNNTNTSSNIGVYLSLLDPTTGKSIALSPSSSILTPGVISLTTLMPDSILRPYSLLMAQLYTQPSTTIQSNQSGISYNRAVDGDLLESAPMLSPAVLSIQPALTIYDYRNLSYKGMNAVGYVFSIVVLLCLIAVKVKSHFIAEEANAVVLHTFNFAQIIYLYKWVSMHSVGEYYFFSGYGIVHLSFFPNFFTSLIPSSYIQSFSEPSLVPDGNLNRNAGYSFSWQIIILGVTLVAIAISFLVSYIRGHQKQNDQMMNNQVARAQVDTRNELPLIRLIMRMGIILFQIGFMNELFFAFVELIQPHTIQPEYTSFANSNRAGAYATVFIVPILIAAIIYHYYCTYNSDLLQHYATLRELLHYIFTYAQAVILALSVGKPLLTLMFLPLEIIHFVFNHMLYKYGVASSWMDSLKFIVISTCFAVTVILLSLVGRISWVIIAIGVCVSSIVALIYCGYQVVGIYWGDYLQKQQEKQKERKEKEIVSE